MPEVYGCDFSYFKPTVRALQNGGFSFVMGYVSGGGEKDLTQPLIAAYAHAGIHVGLVWETTANRVLGGGPAGASDGLLANTQAKFMGYPTTAPIFFPVDYDAPESDYPAIAAYGAAFNNAIVNPCGIYGKYDVIEHFVTPNNQPIQYGWQTAAWSGDRLSQKAHLYQRNTHHHILSGAAPDQYDEDVLCIPLPLMGVNVQPPEEFYIVCPGDTLTSISTKFHTSVYQLEQWNHITDPNYIQVGERLRVR